MTWQAARSGLPADTAAANHAAQVNQFLAAHGITVVYPGNQLITPSGLVGYGYGSPVSVSLGTYDIDQPFTLPAGHTAIGRATLPLVPSGNGADLTVSLCADSGGSPGTVIASTVLPKEHLACLASGPLATAASMQIVPGDMTAGGWQSPVSGAGSPSSASSAVSGNFIVTAGGRDATAATFTSQCFTTAWAGGTAPGTVLPQPSLPSPVALGTLVATGDVLVYAGGWNNSSVTLANVWAGGWSPASGQAQAWSAQTALPVATQQAAGAFDPDTDTVYVIGGQTGTLASTTVATVWQVKVTNGQLGAWTAGPSLPAARADMFAAVVNGWLVAAGGADTSGNASAVAWRARVNPDGSLSPWQQIADLPYSAAWSNANGSNSSVIPGTGLLVFGGTNGGGDVYQAASLPVTADGPGSWLGWQLDSASNVGTAAARGTLAGVFTATSGWEILAISPFNAMYASGPLTQIPSVSVPLPATGLTGGAIYHLLVHQQGGTAADYVSVTAGAGAQASSAQTRPSGGGSWTPMSGHLYSLYAGVFDQAAAGNPVHLWEDSGARVTTLLYGSGTGLLLGVLEATAFLSGSPRPVLPAVTEVTWSGGQPSGLVQLA